MKKLLSIMLLMLVASCSSTIKIIEFTGPEKINEGEKMILIWQVENAERISIENIKTGLAEFGRLEIDIDTQSVFTLIAESADQKVFKKHYVDVIPKKREIIEKPVVKQEVSRDTSNYVKGLIDYQQSIDGDWKFSVFGFDKSNYPQKMGIYVAVKDRFGNFVANLAPPYGDSTTYKEYFRAVIESIGGKTREITDFQISEHHDYMPERYNFALSLDHSGSMWGEPIRSLQNSVRKFFRLIKDEDNVSVVKYDWYLHIESPLLPKSQAIGKYMFDSLDRFGRATALIASGSLAVNTLEDAKENKILILFTDGWENCSFYSSFLLSDFTLAYKPSHLIHQARENKVKIYTVGYGKTDENLLKKIALLTDGKYYYANRGKEMEQIFEELPRLFHNYYYVSYKPSSSAGMHSVSIETINKAGNKSAAKGETFVGDKIEMSEYEEDVPQTVAFFQFSSSKLSKEFVPFLEKFSNYLKSNTKAMIEIHGHTDSRGSKAQNLALSKSRAERVKKVLVDNGIPQNRIKTIGFGFKNPIHNPEYYEWEAQENRRVEILITQ